MRKPELWIKGPASIIRTEFEHLGTHRFGRFPYALRILIESALRKARPTQRDFGLLPGDRIKIDTPPSSFDVHATIPFVSRRPTAA